MLKKRKIREIAMQILFLWDSQENSDAALAEQVALDGSEDPEIRRGALDIALATWEQRKATDEKIERIAPQWPTRRQPGVDRNLIRMAVWEMTSTDTPPKVVIDEAIELSKQFSTEQSPAFINGVLDAVLKEHESLTQVQNADCRMQNGGKTTQ